MRDFTLFVDESGQFEPETTRWPVGLRTVGGVLVPLPPDAAGVALEDVLSKALESAGLPPGWRPVHARDFLHPPALVERCAAAQGLSPDIRDLARRAAADPDARRRLCDVGRQALTSIRRALGEALTRLIGRIVLVSEYGGPAPLGPLPARWPYVRMADALATEASLGVFLRDGCPARFHLVLAARHRGRVQVGLGSWVRLLVERLGRSGCVLDVAEGSPAELPAEEHAGLQAADVVVHALGPGSKHSVLPSAEQVLCRSLACVREKASRLFHVRGEDVVIEHDALGIHTAVRGLVESFAGDEPFAGAQERLLSAMAPPLPPGVFPSAAETAQWTASSLEARR